MGQGEGEVGEEGVSLVHNYVYVDNMVCVCVCLSVCVCVARARAHVCVCACVCKAVVQKLFTIY